MWLYSENIAGTDLNLDVGRLDFEDDRRWWWDDELDAARIALRAREVRGRRWRWRASSRPTGRTGAGSTRTRIGCCAGSARRPGTGGRTTPSRSSCCTRTTARPSSSRATSCRSSARTTRTRRLTWLGARATGAASLRFGGSPRLLARRGLRARQGAPRGVRGRPPAAERGRGGRVGATCAAGRSTRGSTGCSPSPSSRASSGARGRLRRQRPRLGHRPLVPADAARGQRGRLRRRRALRAVRRRCSSPSSRTSACSRSAPACRCFRSSSLDLVYHAYRLLEPTDELRDSRLELDARRPAPGSRPGLDLVLALEEWERVEFHFIARRVPRRLGLRRRPRPLELRRLREHEDRVLSGGTRSAQGAVKNVRSTTVRFPSAVRTPTPNWYSESAATTAAGMARLVVGASTSNVISLPSSSLLSSTT